MFAVALGISFAVRLVQTGVNACFNGSLIGLLYILAVYVALYLLARFVFNRWFSRSSLIVAIAGFANVSYGLIGLGSFHGVHPAVTVALEASAAAFFIVARRGAGEMSTVRFSRADGEDFRCCGSPRLGAVEPEGLCFCPPGRLE